MKRLYIPGLLMLATCLLSFLPANPALTDMTVWEVLFTLGAEAPNHLVNEEVDGVSTALGENLVKTGFANGKRSFIASKQSKHFDCTACHNLQKEDPDLRYSDPEARLAYAKENGIPFLQGTTLYGVVNRSSFYNGDYEKKYGDLVEPTRNDLREAIQLCAIECSQGRRFKEQELESVLAYLWTLQLKMSDLMLTSQEKEIIEQATNEGRENKKNEALRLVQSKFLSGSPATFLDPPKDRKKAIETPGDAALGKDLYQQSCLHCHENSRYAFFDLADHPLSLNQLNSHLARYTHLSTYQVVRYGTSPLEGKRTYMPNYTKERMSNQQLADLVAYIQTRGK